MNRDPIKFLDKWRVRSTENGKYRRAEMISFISDHLEKALAEPFKAGWQPTTPAPAKAVSEPRYSPGCLPEPKGGWPAPPRLVPCPVCRGRKERLLGVRLVSCNTCHGKGRRLE